MIQNNRPTFTFSLRKVQFLFCMAFSMLLSFSGMAQEKYFHYSPEGKAFFALSDSRIFIRFNSGVDAKTEESLLSREDLLLPVTDKMRIPAPKGILAEFKKNVSESDIKALLSRLNKAKEVFFANPILVFRDGTEQAALDRFAVKLNNSKDFPKLVELVNGIGAQIDEQNKYDPLVYFVKVSKNSPGNAMELANRLAETKLFKFSEPDMLRLMKRFNTNDPNLGLQWSLNNTGSSTQYNGVNAGGIVGADMRVFSA